MTKGIPSPRSRGSTEGIYRVRLGHSAESAIADSISSAGQTHTVSTGGQAKWANLDQAPSQTSWMWTRKQGMHENPHPSSGLERARTSLSKTDDAVANPLPRIEAGASRGQCMQDAVSTSFFKRGIDALVSICRRTKSAAIRMTGIFENMARGVHENPHASAGLKDPRPSFSKREGKVVTLEGSSAYASTSTGYAEPAKDSCERTQEEAAGYLCQEQCSEYEYRVFPFRPYRIKAAGGLFDIASDIVFAFAFAFAFETSFLKGLKRASFSGRGTSLDQDDFRVFSGGYP